MAADGGEKGVKVVGALGRNDFPCFQIGVTHAFFRVFPIVQNSVCQRVEFPSVRGIRLGNGIFISCPEQFDDFLIFQEQHILSICSSPR